MSRRKFRTNKNIVFSCQYHIVWCTKYRRKVLVYGVDERLKEIIQDVAEETQAEVIELEVMPDHVHVLIDCDPQYGIYKIVKQMKGRSSRFLRQEFPWLKSRLPTLWTNSMCVVSTGGAPIAVIKRYIKNQKNA